MILKPVHTATSVGTRLSTEVLGFHYPVAWNWSVLLAATDAGFPATNLMRKPKCVDTRRRTSLSRSWCTSFSHWRTSVELHQKILKQESRTCGPTPISKHPVVRPIIRITIPSAPQRHPRLHPSHSAFKLLPVLVPTISFSPCPPPHHIYATSQSIWHVRSVVLLMASAGVSSLPQGPMNPARPPLHPHGVHSGCYHPAKF